MKNEYEKDFYAWTVRNAKLIRYGKFSEVDVEHVAEEIECMGRSEKRELINRLAVLMAHLLKWQFQTERRSRSWEDTIEEQRISISDLLEDNPSLKHEINNKIDHAYRLAVFTAARETGLNKVTFPLACVFTLEQCLDSRFFPEK